MLTATAMGFFQREIERAVVWRFSFRSLSAAEAIRDREACPLIVRALALGEDAAA